MTTPADYLVRVHWTNQLVLSSRCPAHLISKRRPAFALVAPLRFGELLRYFSVVTLSRYRCPCGLALFLAVGTNHLPTA